MGIFDIFNKKKNNAEKVEHKVPEYYGVTSDLLGEVEDLASKYLVDESMLDIYSKDKLEVKYLNEARQELEEALKNLNKSLEEYYDNEYTIASATKEKDKTFPYSLEALVVLFNNSLDLYAENESAWDTLNLAYNKCNGKLNKVKEVLSDDEAIQKFTGLKPIVKEEEKIEETEVTNEESNEEVASDASVVVENVSDDVDGDIIVNTDKIKMYFIRISRNEDDALNLNLCIENKTDKNVVVESKEVIVDGRSTEPVFNCNISAETRVFDKMIFNTNVDQLVNLECSITMKDSNTNELLEECKVSMFKEN